MLAPVTEVFAVYPIKSRNAAEQEATQCSTVIFLPRKFANDSSFEEAEGLYTPGTVRVKAYSAQVHCRRGLVLLDY
jgi:hypothetical protein